MVANTSLLSIKLKPNKLYNGILQCANVQTKLYTFDAAQSFLNLFLIYV